MADHLSHSP